ncbi:MULTISPECIES: molybdopterin molybdotransferase MoeA [Halorussus]|uniref:molybdopterin molybdotransferase MoeA n=1 Tax=Halorussus TaxID=1070314 RepID=UPI00209F8F99|nr:molybdopterin molybdotransferase MoeA [Halorussus vallis]USZ78320.1 molybdopterin molybdotransferase MoeA [Halorussus vallis]USZ78343.1 molybdopterin molybdotransferase MoeA [Halorussus vallis]
MTDHGHEDMLWRSEAVRRVLDLRASVRADRSTESVPLDATAGRTLGEDVTADADAPETSCATMDGYAFDATDDYPLDVHDEEVFPEDDGGALEPGEAVEIATGAPLPQNANVVLKREDATVEDGRLTGPALEPGTYVYERGSNYRAGETLFEAGERLAPRDAVLLADLGYSAVAVCRRLSAGVLATGTEIHTGRTEDLDSPMLQGLVRSWGHEATYEGTVPDDYDRVKDRIEAVAEDHDMVLTTGGTSVGHKDHVVRALDELGDVLFHRVRVRPGKPIAVAELPDQDAVAFAIPGKPVGAHAVATLVARPFFTGAGTDLPGVEATLSRAVTLGPDGFEYAVPVLLDGGEATPYGHVDSPLRVYDEQFDPSVLSSSTRATRADGIVVTTDDLAEGETVTVVPYSVLE